MTPPFEALRALEALHVAELMVDDDVRDQVRIRMGWPIGQKLVKYRIIARAPEREPWSILDFIRGLVDVGRVHESAFVTRLTADPSVFGNRMPGLVTVDFFAPAGWRPQPDLSLPVRDAPYFAGGPGTRHWPEGGGDVP